MAHSWSQGIVSQMQELQDSSVVCALCIDRSNKEAVHLQERCYKRVKGIFLIEVSHPILVGLLGDTVLAFVIPPKYPSCAPHAFLLSGGGFARPGDGTIRGTCLRLQTNFSMQEWLSRGGFTRIFFSIMRDIGDGKRHFVDPFLFPSTEEEAKFLGVLFMPSALSLLGRQILLPACVVENVESFAGGVNNVLKSDLSLFLKRKP